MIINGIMQIKRKIMHWDRYLPDLCLIDNNNNNSHIYYTYKFAKCLLSDTAACGRNSWQWHKHSAPIKKKVTTDREMPP